MQLNIYDMGRIGFEQALSLQYALVEQRQRDLIPDTLLLLEHDPVITLGKRGDNSDLLFSREQLAERGVDLAWIDRGGQATYHGPGQLVAYPIIHLRNHERKLKRFIHNLEEVLIRLLQDEFALQAGRHDEHIGVWIDNRKIAAIGISVHQKVTMHGLALNVSTDLDYFSLIVPCGIRDRTLSVTSISRETGGSFDLETVKRKFVPVFCGIYGYIDTRYPSVDTLPAQEGTQ